MKKIRYIFLAVGGVKTAAAVPAGLLTVRKKS